MRSSFPVGRKVASCFFSVTLGTAVGVWSSYGPGMVRHFEPAWGMMILGGFVGGLIGLALSGYLVTTELTLHRLIFVSAVVTVSCLTAPYWILTGDIHPGAEYHGRNMFAVQEIIGWGAGLLYFVGCRWPEVKAYLASLRDQDSRA